MKSVRRLFFTACFFVGAAWVILGDDFSVSLPANSSVTMGDGSGTLVFTVTNESTSSNAVKYVEFDFSNSLYNADGSSSAPSGWRIATEMLDGGRIVFVTDSATTAITIGGSKVFQVVVRGVNGANIPSSSQDQADSLTDMVVSKGYISSFGEVTGPQTPTFDLVDSLPSWKRRSLSVSITASPSTVAGGGSVTVTASVTNRTTGAVSSIAPSTPVISATGTAGAGLSSGPTPTSASIGSGQTGNFSWTYTATPSGTIQFRVSAASGSSVTSSTQSSNTVVVGNLTASLSLSISIPPQ